MPDRQDYPDTPVGYAARWEAELRTAKENVKPWWERGDKVIARYVDDRKGDSRPTDGTSRLNLFTSNIQTMISLLYGKTPQVDVARRFADSEDDQARVASEMLERLLNTDIEKDNDTASEALRQALEDRLLPGMGNARCRYDVRMMAAPGVVPEEGQQVPEVKDPSTECVYVDYVYWKDQLWSPCRTFHQLRWWAFGNDMSEEDFAARFGKEKLKAFQDKKKGGEPTGESADGATQYKDHLARCYVWEIWSKERKTVDWFVEGYPETLDHKDDPLGLENFWPFPRPMMANLTTSKFLPVPDFALAQDLYDGIDRLESRIDLLEDAIRVAGLYDTTNEEVKRLLDEKGRNVLYPVDATAFNAMAEKGGMQNAVMWLPLEQIVGALDKLRECRTEKIGLLYQVTGMSDIMRGQASQQTTATEQAIKARFASVRVQSMQDEFARFCSDVQKIKAEIIAKHYDAQTIIERSNAARTSDGKTVGPDGVPLIAAAVTLITGGRWVWDPQASKLIPGQPSGGDIEDYRIVVNPDSVSLTDFAALKQERGEFAQTIATYFQGMMPLMEMSQAAGMVAPTVEFVFGLAEQLVAGLHGSNEMEGVFDQFMAALKQQQEQQAMNPQPPQQDPQLEVAKVKAGAEQFKAKAEVAKTQLDLHVAQQKHGMDMQKMQAQRQADSQGHNESMQSQEGQERLAAMKQVDRVTGGAA